MFAALAAALPLCLAYSLKFCGGLYAGMREHGEDKSPAARMTPRCGIGMGGSAVQCSPAVIGAARRSHGAGHG